MAVVASGSLAAAAEVVEAAEMVGVVEKPWFLLEVGVIEKV